MAPYYYPDSLLRKCTSASSTCKSSLRASSPIWASEASLARTRELGTAPPAPRGFATRSRVLARLGSLAQIGELARRLVQIEDAPDACLAILYALEWFQVNSNHKPRETRLKKPLPGRNKVSFRKIARYFEKLIVEAAKI